MASIDLPLLNWIFEPWFVGSLSLKCNRFRPRVRVRCLLHQRLDSSINGPDRIPVKLLQASLRLLASAPWLLHEGAPLTTRGLSQGSCLYSAFQRSSRHAQALFYAYYVPYIALNPMIQLSANHGLPNGTRSYLLGPRHALRM
jgi:hypothetical protein